MSVDRVVKHQWPNTPEVTIDEVDAVIIVTPSGYVPISKKQLVIIEAKSILGEEWVGVHPPILIMEERTRIISNFITDHPELNIKKITYDKELTIWFNDSDDPWSIQEFKPESMTYEVLTDLALLLSKKQE